MKDKQDQKKGPESIVLSGTYRHYKGKEYEVIGEALTTDGQQEMIVYKQLDGDQIWLRPKAEFLEEVERDGQKQMRFSLVDASPLVSWEDKYKRALADYHNLIKQQSKEKEEFVRYAVSDFLTDLIPVYDHLKLSLKGLSEEESNSAWAQGVKHVLKQFRELLVARGVEEIKTVGEKFDHDIMEAIDGSGELVIQEVMPGYKLNSKLIRPAKVIVGEDK